MRQTEKEKIQIIVLAIVGFIMYVGLQAYEMTEDYKVKQEMSYGISK